MILVTGATGFLGHHLIPLLSKAGYSLRALVRPTSETDFLRKHNVELAVAEDISAVEEVTKAAVGCEAIIHAAGQFRFWGDYDDFWQTNVAGTQAVLDAALAQGVKRVVYVSTIAVAGHIPVGSVIDEDFDCQPQDAYQKTKYEAENLALNYHEHKDVDVVVVRPGAFYGPWGRYAFNRLFFEEPLRGWRIRVAKGKHVQFPVFVPDVAQGVKLALEKGRPGELYNICGQSITHNEGNNIVSDLADISRWRMDIPKWAVLSLAWSWTKLSKITKREPFYPINLRLYVFQDWQVSSEKAKRELGFKPTPFPEGAARTLSWYKNQGIL